MKTLRFDWESVFILGIVFMFGWALWETRKFNLKAGLFPWAIGCPVLALSVVQFFMDLLGKKGRVATARAVEAETDLSPRIVHRRTLGILGWILGYFGVIWLLGFSIGGPLCAFIQLKFASREKWLITLVLTASVWLFIYGLFDRVLHVPFFTGQALLWLGLSAE